MLSSAAPTIAMVEIHFFKDELDFRIALTLGLVVLVMASALVLWAGEVCKYFQRKKRT